MPNEDVIYWKPSKSQGFCADLIEVWETQKTEWDQTAKRFNPVVMIEVEPGKWKPFHDPAIIKMMQDGGKNSFPSTTITLRFMTESNQEIRWELRTGYKNRVSSEEQAMMNASDGAVDFTKCRNLAERADAIGQVFGGMEWNVSTPGFPLTGDLEAVITRLVDEGWWTLEDVVRGVNGRKPMPLKDDSGREYTKEELIKNRAAEGFVSRPFKIELRKGNHPFQGFVSLEAYLTERAKQPGDGGDSLYDEDIPF